MKRLLKILGIGLGAVVALLVLAFVAVALFVDLDKVVNDQLAVHKPKIEEQLGRKVEVGEVKTKLFPTLRVEVASVSVAAQKPDEPALLSIGPVRISVGLWDAIRTQGEQISINEVVVQDLKLHLVRDADGRLSYEDILERQAQTEEEPASDEPAEDEGTGLGGLRLDELRVENAEIVLVDHATATGQPAQSRIGKLNVRVTDLRADESVKVAVDAALFSDATNFRLATSYGPLPRDAQSKATPSVGGVTLKLDQVDLSQLSPYLPASAGARIDSALASADWSIGAIQEGQPLPVKGFFEVQKLQLEGGEKFDLRVDTDLTADLAGPGVDIAQFDLKVGEVAFTASGSVSDLSGSPKFRDFKLRSTTLSPQKLFAYYPPARADLPEGTRLGGNAVLDITASGDAAKQTVDAKLDLGALDIHYPGTLSKPQGVPMKLEVKGDFTAQDALLERLALVLDDLELIVKGKVLGYDQTPRFDLTASTGPFTLDRLVRLAPSVRESLREQKATASGQGTLSGHLKGTQADLDGALDFRLAGMKLDVPGTKLDGDLHLKAVAEGNPDKSLHARLEFDANNAVILVKDVMDKGLKTPLKLDVSLRQTPQRLDVETFDLKLAELGLQVTGGIDYPKNQVDVRVDMQRLDLEKFSRTVTALPKDLVKDSHLAMKMNITGDPDRMETLVVAMTSVDARIGKSDLRGDITLRNPTKPDLKMKVRSRLLDLDQLLGDEEEAAAGTGEGTGTETPAQDDPSLRDYTLYAELEADRVIYAETDLTKFRGVVRLKDGRLVLEDATFNAYGGTVSAKGTEAEIWRGKMPFKANISATGIELGQALAQHTKYGNVLQGKADLKMNLSGKGYDTPDLEQFLSGAIDLGLRQGKFNKASVTDGVVSRLDGIEKIPGVSLQPLKGENAIRDLVAKLTVKDGKLLLEKPIAFMVDQARTTLEGAVGIGGKLFLDGTYHLPAQVLAKATGGKCTSDKEIPVPLAITGTIDGPQYQPKAGEVTKTVLQRCATQAATNAAQSKLEEKLGTQLPAGVPTNVEDARAKAQAEAARARAEAEAKARAEAERRAAEEKKKAEDALKKKAKDKLKGFGF